ncbi:potassium voltage-gated channel subfamily KQT member 1 isoform X1 [Hydra vulgaris]|uniref:Potassium voltage-gated channel subfamily KQT member 4 n=1 Tax=Hydra vulgaris TaxID=6087 RepID=T2MEJ5_HYDVU|nr:potassium voltage-gated channel subfamily KQT member 1-like [Hydra vulgaris]
MKHQCEIELNNKEKMSFLNRNTLQKSKTIHKTRMSVFYFLEKPQTIFALLYHKVMFVLVLVSLSLSILITIESFARNTKIHSAIYYIEVSLAIVFTAEYSLRVWSCSIQSKYAGVSGRLRFIKRPYVILDMIVILATIFIIYSHKIIRDDLHTTLFQFLNFLQILRILRLDRQQGAFKIMSLVVYEHRQELMTCWYLSFILLAACSFLVYIAEKNDSIVSSNKIKNLGEGIYFGMITLLTIGYGDFSPNSWIAKIIVVVFAFIGTAFFALPAGILGSGFALKVAQNQKKKHFNRRRVPAALIIQYVWRNYSTQVNPSSNTWTNYRMIIKEKHQTLSMNNTPILSKQNNSNKNVVGLHKKNQVDRKPFKETTCATIPSAVNFRNRPNSDGNLIVMFPTNIEEHQGTIVSLPASTDVDLKEFLKSRINVENQRSCTRQLNRIEKIAVRFLIKIKIKVALRKFKVVCRPYDIKDVIEQYTSGQIEMFGFIRKFQSRIENALGIQDGRLMIPSLDVRMDIFEKKIDTLSVKLDNVMELLNSNSQLT